MWIKTPSELFSSMELFLSGQDNPSQTFNKLSRLLIVLSVVVWWKFPEYLERFLLYGFIVILAIYVIQNNPSPRQKKKEKFSPLTYKMDAPLSVNQSPSQPVLPSSSHPLNLPELAAMAHAQSLGLVTPSVQPMVQPMVQQQPVSAQPMFQPMVQQQPVSAQPMFQPMVQQQQVSAQPMVQQQQVSAQPMFQPMVQQQQVSAQPMVQQQPVSAQPMFQPMVQQQPVSAQTIFQQQSMVHPASIQPRNYLQTQTEIHVDQSMMESNSIPSHSTPLTELSNKSVIYVSKELLPQEERVTPIQYLPRQPTVSELQRSLSKPLTTSLSKAMSKVEEEQDWLRPPQKFYTPNVGINPRMYQAPILAPRMMDTDFSDIQTNRPVNFNPLQDMGMSDERKVYAPKKKNRALLLEKTEDESDCVPSANFVQGNNKFYMQDIQPNVYSFTYDPTPINSNIGISYAPQNPPLQKVNMCTPDGNNYPVFTRIDPQLIRDDVHPQRREELPRRGPWSEKYGDFEASTSTDGVTSIYDPRFTGYGDEYRSYQDVNLGNVKYYYTDVDSYRSPNFVIRNKVDHVDMKQPMGDIYSSYPQEASLEDVRDIVNNDWMAKSTEHREDLMAQQMAKSNRRNWQMRFAPRSRGSNLSTFTSGY